MFTIRHFIWLFICIIMISFILFSFNKKKPSLDKVLTTALIVSLLSEFTKLTSVIELVPSSNGELLLPYIPLNHLPLHLCSIQIILIAMVKFTNNKERRETLLSFMAPTCFFGALLALLMPSIFTTTITIEQAFTHPVSYQFFIFHSMLVALGVIIVKSNEIKWEFKHFKNACILVYLLIILSIYLNSILASPTYVDGKLVSVDFWTNFFFTYQNPLNIKLTQIWQWYLYLVFEVLLATFLLYIFYMPLIKKSKKGE